MRKQRDQLGGFPTIQVRDNGGLNEGGNSGGVEKWLNSRYILKVEPVDFADRFKVGIRRGWGRGEKEREKLKGWSSHQLRCGNL